MRTSIAEKHLQQLTWLIGFTTFLVVVSHTLRGCTLYLSNATKVSFAQLPLFYCKRFFRIWPAFFISLLVYLLFAPILSFFYPKIIGVWIEEQFLSDYSLFNVLSYLSLTFNFSDIQGIFNNAYWSLPVEFQYYLIFPVIIFSLRFGFIGPLFLAAILYVIPKLIPMSDPSSVVFLLAFSFCDGVLIGRLYESSRIRLSGFIGSFVIVILFCIVSAIRNSLIPLPDLLLLSSKSNWYGIFALMIILVLLLTQFQLPNKISSILQHYGTISYSTYFYHNIFVAISVLLLIKFKIYDANTRLFFTLFSTLMVATLSYKYIENPSTILGKNLFNRFISKKQKV